MFTEEKVKAMVDQLSLVAIALLKEEHYHEPMVLCFAGDAILPVHLGQVMDTAEELFEAGKPDEAYAVKATMWDSVRKIARDSNSFGTVLITEAWYQYIPKAAAEVQKENLPSPRFSPERQEALTLSWEFRMMDGRKLSGSRQWVFKRDSAGEKVVEIGEPDNFDSGGSSGPATSFIA